MKILCLVFLASLSGQALAATSQYSDFDIKKCKQLNKTAQEDGGGVWSCPGIKGYEVTYFEGDLRGTIAFGPEAKNQCTAGQSFSAFNSPGAKIEWRMDKAKPVATILRWITDNGIDNTKHSWLVVTKLSASQTCRTAIVDGSLPEPNKIARERADLAQSFNCEKDQPEIVSRIEFKPNELATGSPCGKGPFQQ